MQRLRCLPTWLLLCGVCGILGCDAARARNPRSRAAQHFGFDYLILTRAWPPSLCEQQKCTQPTYNLFTIQGLRPSNISGSQPANCPTNITFDKNDLAPELRGRMSCEWRSFQGDNAGLWGRQWRTYGACTLPLFKNTSAYFQGAVALSERLDLNEALVKGGVNPLIARAMTPGQLAGILEQQWKVTPIVTCSNGNILDVRTCFSTRLKPIDCPPSAGGTSNCPAVAQALPYGNSKIPEACTSYFDNVPAATEGAAVPATGATAPAAPGSDGSAQRAASWLLMGGAAVVAAVVAAP